MKTQHPKPTRDDQTTMKTLLLVTTLVLTTLVGSHSPALAQETKRPLEELFQTETVYPQEKGEFQFTFVSKFSKSAETSWFETPLRVEYGLTDRWQVELEWSGINRLRTSKGKTRGPGDLQIGTKYSWMNIHGANLHLAAGFELGLPTGSVAKGIGEGQIEYEPYVVVARDFPKLDRLQLFSQLGISFTQRVTETDDDDDEARGRTLEWNSGFFLPYRKARLTAEFNWSRNSHENSLYVTPGIIWKLPREVEFGFGMPFGVSRGTDRFRAIVTLTYEFGGSRDER